MSIEFLETDFDKVSCLANLLTARATGLAADSNEFEVLRRELLSNPNLVSILPQWLRLHRNLDTIAFPILKNSGPYIRIGYFPLHFLMVVSLVLIYKAVTYKTKDQTLSNHEKS